MDNPVPNLILRSGLILHAAGELHCKSTEIYHAARRGWSNRVRGHVSCAASISSHNQKWQYGTFRNFVLRTLNRTVPAYRNSVQFLKHTVPTYHIRTITKKAYCTSVPYFLAKVEAYRTVLPFLLLTTRNFN